MDREQRRRLAYQEQRKEVFGIWNEHDLLEGAVNEEIKAKEDILADMKEAIDVQREAIVKLKRDRETMKDDMDEKQAIEKKLDKEFDEEHAKMELLRDRVSSQGVLLNFQSDQMEAKREELEHLRKTRYDSMAELRPIMNGYEHERATQIFQSLGWPRPPTPPE